MCHCHPFTFTAVKHSAGCLHHSSLIPSALGGHWTISGLSYYRQCCKRHSRSCPFGIRGCSSCSCRFLGMELLLDRVCLTSFFFFYNIKVFFKEMPPFHTCTCFFIPLRTPGGYTVVSHWGFKLFPLFIGLCTGHVATDLTSFSLPLAVWMFLSLPLSATFLLIWWVRSDIFLGF